MTPPTLLSSDSEWRAWLKEQGLKPHPFRGSLDRDCETCGLSVYVPVHDKEFDL